MPAHILGMIRHGFDPTLASGHYVCVVGAGPVGIGLALRLADLGQRVLLLEAGTGESAQSDLPLGPYEIKDRSVHAVASAVSRQGLGGTSAAWGGECVSLDPGEFLSRPHVPHTEVTLRHAEVNAYHKLAADYFGFASPDFAVETQDRNATVASSDLIRVCPEVNMGKRHHGRLLRDPLITVCLRCRVTRLDIDPETEKIRSVEIATGGQRHRLAPPLTVLCCGGIQSTRLMLMLQRDIPGLLNGDAGPLGRYYMGHLSGSIARINFANPEAARQFLFVKSDDGSFARRSFVLSPEVQHENKLLNSYFGITNFPIGDPGYRNGALSTMHLGLSLRYLTSHYMAHFRPDYMADEFGLGLHALEHLYNIVTGPVTTFAGLVDTAKWLRQRKVTPNFGLYNPRGLYALRFHAEQAPNPESRVTLSDQTDDLGLPLPKIDFRFSEQDFTSVLRSHEVLNDWLMATGLGTLTWHHPEALRKRHVQSQARDGFHQIGLTRMSTGPKTGVVDGNLAVHGIRNLFIAGCATLPASGKAHPTFPATIYAMRLAEHLVRQTGATG